MSDVPFPPSSKSVDIYGNETITSVKINRGTGDLLDALRLVKQLEKGPKDTVFKQRAVSRNGLLQFSISPSDLTTEYAYDGLGRQITVTDPRENDTQTEYYTGGTGSKGKVKWVLSSGNRTYYTYNADGSLYWTAVNATLDGEGNFATGKRQYTSHEYLVDNGNYAGERQRTWGETTYPVEYVFDAYGRQTEMRTWRAPESPADYWAGGSWPTTPPDAELTQWRYETATGLLLRKLYHGDTDESPGISYTYTADGKMASRTWKRGVTTNYYYNDGTGGTLATGELRKVDYSDATPDVTFAYDRLERRTTVTEGGSTTHSSAYEDDGGDSLLRLDTETITRDGYTKVIARKYEDGSGSTLEGRDAGFTIGTEYDATYAYDGKGRLERVIGPGLDSTYGAAYARLTNEAEENTSDLVEYTYFKSSAGATLATIHRTYEGTRNLVDFVENQIDGTPAIPVSKYKYANDILGRRTNVIRTGRAVDDTSPYDDTGFTEDFGYNDRSELTAADRFLWTTEGQGDRLTTYGEYDYVYDHIGNRRTGTTYADMGTTRYSTGYTTNDLNQYTLLTNPSEDLKYYDPPTQTIILDGNLTQDGTFTYSWDAENRLIEVVPASPSNDPPRNKKVKFVYDYMGRRVQKAVYVYNNGWPENPGEVQRFVYDEWNVVLVLNGSNETVRKYTWGLDLSGTIHGAGGIGGLLATDEAQGTHQGSYWFFYDANGNVGQVLKTTKDGQGNITGVESTLAAHYEYDPYGNLIASSGAYADANPFRFSTKWFDVETGLYYYGYRYYSPRLGRWISRDPIGELGGWQLYLAMHNSAVNHIDPQGLVPVPAGVAAAEAFAAALGVTLAACLSDPTCTAALKEFLKLTVGGLSGLHREALKLSCEVQYTIYKNIEDVCRKCPVPRGRNCIVRWARCVNAQAEALCWAAAAGARLVYIADGCDFILHDNWTNHVNAFRLALAAEKNCLTSISNNCPF